MGPVEIAYGLLAIALGGGVGALIKSRADSKAIRSKLGPEVDSINVVTLTNVIAGQDVLNENLTGFLGTVRAENVLLRTRYARLHAWALDLVTHWAEHRTHAHPPELPDDIEERS